MARRPTSVLVIDDDLALCELLRATLVFEGVEVTEAHHVVEAEQLLARALPDAIVLDIGLPGVDGIFYCARLRESPRTKDVPIVAISGSEEAGTLATAAGAHAFVQKPFDPLQLVAVVERVLGVMPLRKTAQGEQGELRRLIAIAQHQHELLIGAYRLTLEALVDALESRDFGTSAHSRRVAAYATRLTLEVAPSLVDDPTLEWGFLLHDVGKIGIPDQVLLKRGPLTTEERRCVEQHTIIGERLVGHVPLLAGTGLGVIRSHHERWDGTGYPDQTIGAETPVAARIFAAADALDAMTGARPYRTPISWDEAVSVLHKERAHQFDPDVVDSLVACEPDLHETYLSTQTLAA